MWPWAHAALGYLAYTLYLRGRFSERPVGLPVVALGFGTQLPDLIDKTLAWYVGVLPYGRSLAHSLLTGTVIMLAVVAALRLRGAETSGTALAIGYASHFFGDAFGSLVSLSFGDLVFLAWPLAPSPSTETVGILTHLRDIEGSPLFLFGLGLTVVGLGLWYRHGLPGLRELVGLLTSEGRSPESDVE
ncbi:metal-dependent hydrolase [Haloglomus halophilum]|uniref:metal-dependent hydrolase n=1 Tax=Haloglomus halophilum TaxID=2962672 RepID=UPI0020C9A5A8|nr:metal-dependent hydrolase [Haloglomus halophilum]